jgi:hypothetical protein
VCDIFIFVPLPRIERDGGTLSGRDFRWDRRRDVYIWPNDKVLHELLSKSALFAFLINPNNQAANKYTNWQLYSPPSSRQCPDH